MAKGKREERLGLTKYNKWNEPMKIVEYESAQHVTVEFQDELKEQKNTDWKSFLTGGVVNPRIKKERQNLCKYNNQGSLMKIIEYVDTKNVIIEFQDKYKYRTNVQWSAFENGNVKNPFYPSVYGAGITGVKYPVSDCNKKNLKEYKMWGSLLSRCYVINKKNEFYTYKNVECCKEWIYYPNFYEWLHSQENFEILMNNKDIEVDKDILIKGNKLYSPDTCCLVPHSINTLFIKSDKIRGDNMIGVTYKTRDRIYEAQCNVNGRETYLGRFHNAEDAFYCYKEFKEEIIKETATQEYSKGTITKRCYDAMMNYEVEITD